jgi:hypothetical protein
LKTIDIEIETIDFLLTRHNKFLLMLNQLDVNTIGNLINFVKDLNTNDFIKKSLKRDFLIIHIMKLYIKPYTIFVILLMSLI